MIKKYKKGDEVIVRVGKDKGKIGKISKIINSADKVVISGVNVSKKHQKPSQESKGGYCWQRNANSYFKYFGLWLEIKKIF